MPEKIAETLQLGALNIHEEEIRRSFRQAVGQFAAQIAVDKRQGHQQRQPKAEGENDRGGERTRPVNIADRQAKGGGMNARAAFGNGLDA